MGVENDKKDFDLAYVTQHITLWFSLKHGYSMSWYFDVSRLTRRIYVDKS